MSHLIIIYSIEREFIYKLKLRFYFPDGEDIPTYKI